MWSVIEGKRRHSKLRMKPVQQINVHSQIDNSIYEDRFGESKQWNRWKGEVE